jgi:hypothetical protein
MAHSLNRSVRAQDFVRHSVQEHKYLQNLKERGLLLEIDNILVDAEQLVLRTFQCNTNYCIQCTGSSATREYKGSCCTDLMVDITRDEKSKLKELAEKARGELELPADGQLGKIISRVLDDEYTEVNEDGEEELRHRESGACTMSWIDETGQFRCSINSLVYKMGLSIEDYKPDPCYVFPLHYTEVGVDTYLISMLSEETRFWIEQDKCVGKLRCLRKPEPGSPPAYQFLKGELEYLVNEEFYRELDVKAQDVLKRFHAGEFDTMFASGNGKS